MITNDDVTVPILLIQYDCSSMSVVIAFPKTMFALVSITTCSHVHITIPIAHTHAILFTNSNNGGSRRHCELGKWG